MASVTVKLDNRPPDSKVEIPVLGLFDNGSTTEVDDVKWELYKAHRGEGNYPEDGVIVIDTAATLEEAQRHVEELEAVEEKVEEQNRSLDDLKKDELEVLAQERGIDTKDMKKQEIIDQLREVGE